MSETYKMTLSEAYITKEKKTYCIELVYHYGAMYHIQYTLVTMIFWGLEELKG